MKVTEIGNLFRIRHKLPNGENIEIKKRFRPSINKNEVKYEMDTIRNQIIEEHYIMGVTNVGDIEEGDEPKPIQEPIQEPMQEPKIKRTIRF